MSEKKQAELNELNEQLDRADIPWKYADYGAERTPSRKVLAERPFNIRFAYWAGKNCKVLRQTERMDNDAAIAYANGLEDSLLQGD